MEIKVNSDNVSYSQDYIQAEYKYQYTKAEKVGNQLVVSKLHSQEEFQCFTRYNNFNDMTLT